MRRWMMKACALSVGILTFLTLTAEVREDEFDCEQAVAHLAECCPGFPVEGLYCQHDFGCGSTRDPDLTLDDSRCILALDCSVLVGKGLCRRAAHLTPMQTTDGCANGDCNGQPTTTQHGRVCQ